MKKVVAITREGDIICKDCLFDSVERAIWNDSMDAQALMEENKIGVIRANELKGKEKCGRCGHKIEVKDNHNE